MQRLSHGASSSVKPPRRGAAAVEFALIVPLFVFITLGAIQTGIGLSAAQTVASALREGGRLASMDYSKRLQKGQTANQKVIQDIKNILTAERIPANQVNITITHADGSQSGSTFDLSDPANDLASFRIKAVLPYSAICTTKFFPLTTNTVSASIVYRKGKTALVQ